MLPADRDPRMQWTQGRIWVLTFVLFSKKFILFVFLWERMSCSRGWSSTLLVEDDLQLFIDSPSQVHDTSSPAPKPHIEYYHPRPPHYYYYHARSITKLPSPFSPQISVFLLECSLSFFNVGKAPVKNRKSFMTFVLSWCLVIVVRRRSQY